MKSRNQYISLWALILFSFIGLTGCIKVDVSTEIKPNGSGIVGISFGMNSEAKDFVSSQGGVPDNAMETLLNTENISREGFKVTTWVDGDYEWTKAEKEVLSVDDINSTFSGNELFTRYDLEHKRGFLKNEFVLDAELAPLALDESISEIDIPITSFIQLTYSLKLPGKIEETNGIPDENNANLLVWTAQEEAVSMQARSTSWNSLNLLLLGGGIFLIIVVVVIVLLLVVFQSKKTPPSQSQAG